MSVYHTVDRHKCQSCDFPTENEGQSQNQKVYIVLFELVKFGSCEGTFIYYLKPFLEFNGNSLTPCF